MSELTDKLRQSKVQPPRGITDPVWAGPCGDGPNGGVTQSLVSRFLCCRERFRLYAIEGLRPVDQFNHKLFYGSAWHVCEEALARGGNPIVRNPAGSPWERALKAFAREQCAKYPTSQAQVEHWYEVVRATFPYYVAYWARQPELVKRTPLLQEQVFDVPYSLPSGRAVRLRGRWDGVELVGGGTAMRNGRPIKQREPVSVWLFETKTKGDIREEQIKRQLTFDLQTGLYMTALTQDTSIDALEEAKMEVGIGELPHDRSRSAVKGVRYNVVRRPLSGGKGSITRHKATKNHPEESKADFYRRVASYVEAEPESYFMRWDVTVTADDVARFRRECLDPILEQMCDWYEYITAMKTLDTGPGNQFYPFTDFAAGSLGKLPPKIRPWVHWRHPFGVWNPMDSGAESDVDEYLHSGSEIGLERATTLFGELE